MLFLIRLTRKHVTSENRETFFLGRLFLLLIVSFTFLGIAQPPQLSNLPGNWSIIEPACVVLVFPCKYLLNASARKASKNVPFARRCFQTPPTSVPPVNQSERSIMSGVLESRSGHHAKLPCNILTRNISMEMSFLTKVS